MKKRILFFCLKLIFTLGLLSFFLYRTNLRDISDAFGGLSLTTVPVVLFFYIISMGISSLKWRLLLPDYSLLSLIKFNLIGVYYSTVLPGQITGDIAKSIIVGKKDKDPHKIAASIFIDKSAGLITMIIVGITGYLYATKKIPVEIIFLLAAFILLIVATFVGIRFARTRRFIQRALLWIGKKFPKTEPVLNHVLQFIEKLSSYLYDPKTISSNILLGLAFHFNAVLINYVLALQFGISVSYFDWCWIYGLVSLVLLLPVSIAGIGLRDGSLVTILGIFSIPPAKTLALSFTMLGFLICLSFIGFILNFTVNRKK